MQHRATVICAFPGCKTQARGRGYCESHRKALVAGKPLVSLKHRAPWGAGCIYNIQGYFMFGYTEAGAHTKESLSRITTMYALQTIDLPGEVHHNDGNTLNDKPSNLAYIKDDVKTIHSLLDSITITRNVLPDCNIPLRPNIPQFADVVWIGDYLPDDFDVWIAIGWWRDQKDNEPLPLNESTEPTVKFLRRL
jgi:hypothetical protein